MVERPRAALRPDDRSLGLASILGITGLSYHLQPQRRALVWGEHERTYAELRTRALSLAGALREAGLQPGDRVAAHLLNRGEMFELYFACAFAGLTLVPVNFRLTAREIGLVLEDSGPGILFTEESLAEVARSAAGGLRVVELGLTESGSTYESMATAAPLAPRVQVTDPHLVLFTSGTTGRPKGVMLTHENIMWFAWQQVGMYRMTPDTVVLLTAPTFNTAGINEQSIPTFLAGGTVVIQPSRRWRPEVLTGLVERWGVTHTLIFPSLLEPILEADRDDPIAFDSLRFVLTGGEHCPAATLLRFARRWSHVRLMEGYGQTENGLVTALTDADLETHPDSIGRLVPGLAIRIVKPDGTDAAVDESGEILTAGPSVSPGYWNAPELTAEAFVGPWLRTGDIGRRDEHGYLYLSGRSKDLIISKGQNIYPAEIESVVSRCDGVREVSVVGVPDEEWGEAVAMAVVRRPGSELSEDALMAFVRTELASYKKPRHVVFLDALPRSAGSKVDKRALATRIQDAVR